MSAPRPRPAALLAAAVLLLPAACAGPAGAQSTTPTPSTTTAPSTTTVPEQTAAQTPKGILLDPADRLELATSLADATERTGVCFGYELDLGGSGADSREEALSNFGPERSLASASGLGSGASSGSGPTYGSDPTAEATRPVTGQELSAGCPKGTMILDVSLTYTSSSSEAEDSASFFVRTSSGLEGVSQATSRLRDLTGVDDKDLLGDEDDLALRNLAAALPLTLDDAQPAADTVTTAAAQAPNGDRLTGSPGSDWIRAHGLGIAIAVGLLLLGLALLLGGRAGRKRTDRPKGPGGFDAGSGSSSTTTP